MPNPHSSVAYVEPNYSYSGLTLAAADGEYYDRAPNLEDYCIALDIIAELSSRHLSLTENMEKENKVIVMSYEDKGDGQKSKVRFMSGTKIGGYDRTSEGEFTARLSTPNNLTTYYADMHITDLVDYGTTEMLGIKSVDVDYNSTCVPLITVKFTDVRGMSIFQPNTLNDDISYNGIRGFSKDNIAQSFFYCFFKLPLPKFTIVLKGFYGRPVSYQVMCDKFDTAFDSKTGSFDVTARFIGYAYSFMTDVSFNVLLAAPYSDYRGEKYWDDQVKGGRFKIPNQSGQLVDMPKLYEIRRNIETLIKESDDKSHETTEESEDTTHENEIQQLTKLRGIYRNWYATFLSMAKTKYGKDFCYSLGGTNEDDDYRYVIIFTNGENIKGNDFSEEYKQFDESFRTMTGQLKASIDEYNNSGKAYRRLNNIKEGFKYPRVKIFKEIWYDDRKKTLKFDGFHADNPLPRKETLNAVFGPTTASQQNKLKTFYNDGGNQYIDAFVIDLDYTDIKRRINALIEDANKQKDDKLKKRRELNKHMYEKLGWYPTVENITKIVMAHLETLMDMMYDTVKRAEGRTIDSLGVASGDHGVVDVNERDNTVAPFPRITSLVTDEDGYTKSEDTWVGNFKNGVGFVEVDIINGLFNAVSKLNQIEKAIEAAKKNAEESESNAADPKEVSVVKMPITSYDFVMTKNPYGAGSIDSIETLAGKVCMRMFGVLALNFFRKEYEKNWLNYVGALGKIEAHNFHNLNKITNAKVLEQLGEGGTCKTGEDMLKIALGESGASKLPWEGSNKDGRAIFSTVGSNKLWLTRYRIYENSTTPRASIQPIQNISFEGLESSRKMMTKGKYPVKDEDIVLIDSLNRMSYDDLRAVVNKSGETTTFNSLKVTDKCNEIWERLDTAQANSIEEYQKVATAFASRVKPNLGEGSGFMTNIIYTSNGNNSFNHIVADELVNDSTSVYYGADEGRAIFAGKDTNKEGIDYTFSNESTYVNEMVSGNIVSYIITECYGYKYEGGKCVHDKSKSLFLMPEFYQHGPWSKKGTNGVMIASEYVKMAYFIMGLDCLDYNTIKSYLLQNNIEYPETTFSYLPNLAVLQIGAAMAYYYTGYDINNKFDINIVAKKLPLPNTFDKIVSAIDCFSAAARIALIKYFRDWCVRHHWQFKELSLDKYVKNGAAINFETISSPCYEKFYVSGSKTDRDVRTVRRALFSQKSNIVKQLTTELMKLVGVVRLNVNAVDNDNVYNHSQFKSIEEWKASKYSFERTQAVTYLDEFIKELRAINGLNSDNDNGNPTTLANSPSQTSEDMQIELYRYLKQLYDKWVSSTSFKTWMFDQFFNDTTTGCEEVENVNPLGNNFYFIDSFYNKIGNKLLINPMKLSEIIHQTTSSMDTNVMMYSFLSQLLSEHRCMLKCVQNFKMLSCGIPDLFVPLPYEMMGQPKVMPDFVIIYAYESSRNLCIDNSEYKNDGFMLNDEFDTPLPIKSRGDETKYYKIPAFGVSYGRQYQSYFKNVRVDMSHPVMTEQAIIAKHNVLAASRNKIQKNVTSQDLYDIYSNQSYTCVVEMMGCAWVQPLMYFVLLNVPFFQGSYLISKVRHRMTPGDMTTEITGVRMSKYCNKLVTEMFTGEDDDTLEGGKYGDERKNNDDGTYDNCSPSVYPIGENGTNGTESTQLTQNDITDGINVMEKLIAKGASVALAAGIAGNMSVESEFNPKALNPADVGYMSGGLCQWRAGNLKALIDNTPKLHGRIKESGATEYKDTTKNSSRYNWTQKKLPGLDVQIGYVIDTLKEVGAKGSWTKGMKGLSYFNSIKDPETAAKEFGSRYELSEHPESERWTRANKLYNEYIKTHGGGGGEQPKPKPQTDNAVKENNSPTNYSKAYVEAIQKTLNTTKSAGSIKSKVHDASGTTILEMSDGNKEKLAALFDIILNNDEYYNHTQYLNWVYSSKGSPSESPRMLVVQPRPSVQPNQRRIYIHDGSGNVSGKLNGTECNEKFMQSLAKRYGSDTNTFVLECPQFSNNPDALGTKEKAVSDCSSLSSGESPKAATPAPKKAATASAGSGTGDTGKSQKASDVAQSAKIMIDGWDVEKAVKWLKDHASPCNSGGYCGKGQCATYVENAIAGCSGGGCKSTTGLRRVATSEAGSKHATNLWYYHILEKIDKGGKSGFVKIATGNCTPTLAGRKVNMALQAGDVAIIGRNAKVEGGKYHACMWSGEEWISDYYQGEKMSPYGNDKDYPGGTLPYAIFRYHNKKGTPKA